MRLLIFVFAVTLLNSPALIAAELPDDPLLLKPVTLAVKGEALSDVARLIAGQTGARLRVAKDIADQKATIFIDEKPAKDVMLGPATLFQYQWRERKAGDLTYYELYQPAQGKKDADAKREELIDRAWNDITSDILKTAELVTNKGMELRQLQKEYDAAWNMIGEDGVMDDTGSAILDAVSAKLEQLGGVGTRSWEMFIHGYSMTCSVLCARDVNKIVNSLKSGLTVCFDSDSPEPEWDIPQDILHQMYEQRKLEQKKSEEMMARMRSEFDDIITVFPEVSSEATGAAVKIKPKVTTERVEAVLEVTYRTEERSDMLSSGYASWDRDIADIVTEEERDYLPHEQGEEEALSRKVSFTMAELVSEAGISWQTEKDEEICLNRSDLLALLHRKTGLQIISDHHSEWSADKQAENLTAKQMLGGRPTECSPLAISGWDGKFAYSRAYDMYASDSAEVPNRLLDRWRGVYRTHGYLPLATLAEISLLDETQRERLENISHLLGLGCIEGFYQLPGYRFYARLTSQQRDHLFGEGLSTESLSREQQAALAEMLEDDDMPSFDEGMFENLLPPELQAELESLSAEIDPDQTMDPQKMMELTPEQEERLAAIFTNIQSAYHQAQKQAFVPVVGLFKDGIRVDKPDEAAPKNKHGAGPFIILMSKENHEDNRYECEVHYPPYMYSTRVQGLTAEEAWGSAIKEHPEAKKEHIYQVQETTYSMQLKSTSDSLVHLSFLIETVRRQCFPSDTSER